MSGLLPARLRFGQCLRPSREMGSQTGKSYPTESSWGAGTMSTLSFSALAEVLTNAYRLSGEESPCVGFLASFLIRKLIQSDKGLTLLTLFNLNYLLFIDPISKHSYIVC